MKDKKTNKKSRKLLIGFPMMFLSIILVFIAVPIIIIFMGSVSDIMEKAGIKMHPNLDDGYLIAEFEDPYGDLLRKIPSNNIYKEAENALDLCKFSVKKVKFSSFSGMGIKPRMNLTFEFQGEFPNPFDSECEFSLPVIHVYINAPDIESENITSDKVANVSFAENDWDYQIIIDGMHTQARIFDTSGKLLGKGLGLYINTENEEIEIDSNKVENRLKNTRITAALPMKMLGDPSEGVWSFYVLTGLVDSKSYSMILPSEDETEPEIFDVVLPHNAPSIELGYQPKLFPLKIEN